MDIINYEQLENKDLKSMYLSADPFPHIVLDNFLDPQICKKVATEIDSNTDNNNWIHHKTLNQDLFGNINKDTYGPATKEVYKNLISDDFVKKVRELTGIEDLVVDKELFGAGIRKAKKGSFLNLHVDFLTHTIRKNLRRKLNLIIYFNENWKEEYNGHLELWDKKCKSRVQKVSPIFNRCIIFETSRSSFHGFPEKINCPEGMLRKSLALYFFTKEEKKLKMCTSHYKYRPNDSLWKKAVVDFGNVIQKVYSFCVRNSLISHETANLILRKLFPR